VLAVVPAGDELAKYGVEVAYEAEGASLNGCATDDAKPHFDQVQPQPCRRSEGDVDAGFAVGPVRISTRLWAAQLSITRCSSPSE